MPHISRHFEDKELVYAWFDAMHTRIDLLLWSNHHTCDELIQCIDAISRETARIEQMGSRFRPDSEVSRLNATKAGTWCNLSYELCRLLDDCTTLPRLCIPPDATVPTSLKPTSGYAESESIPKTSVSTFPAI